MKLTKTEIAEARKATFFGQYAYAIRNPDTGAEFF